MLCNDDVPRCDASGQAHLAIARLGPDNRASVTIEFALIVPVLFAMLVALTELGTAMLATQRMHNTTSAIAQRIALQQISLAEAEQLILAKLNPLDEDENNEGPTDQPNDNGYWVNITSTGETSAAIEVGIAFGEISTVDFFPFLREFQLRAKVDVVY